MHPRTVALIGALALAAGWMLGERSAGRAPGATAGVSRGPRPLGAEAARPVVPLADQLKTRLDRPPDAPRPSRNPFVFGRPGAASPAAGRGPSVPGPEPPAAVPDAAPAGEAPQAWSLTGMAATRVAEGIGQEFTAILSGPAGLTFARAGDALPGGLVVVDVQETSVTLRDDSGVERMLRLR